MNIALDMMGGDYAPEEAVLGVKEYFSGNAAPAHLLLIGDEQKLTPLVLQHLSQIKHYSVVHAPREMP